MHTLIRRTTLGLLFAAALLVTAYDAPLFSMMGVTSEGNHTIAAKINAAKAIAGDQLENPASSPAAAQQSVDEDTSPTATVLVRSLRLRAGPGLEYRILGAASARETFSVLGQAFNCQWLIADHPSLGAVWFSGAQQYTSMNVGCDQVAPADPPAQPRAEETATPPQPVQPPSPEPSAEEGCYLIRGYIGPELTIEVTANDRNWGRSFRFSGDNNQPYCFPPGRYTATIAAPLIWRGLGTQLDVQPGLHTLSPADFLQ